MRKVMRVKLKSTTQLEYLYGLKKLSSKEYEFMKLIWEHPEGISSEEIYNHFKQAQGTKASILFKISEKGYVRNEQRGRHHIYYPKFSQLEYEQALIKQKLEHSFGNPSFLNLVASFCGKSKLSDKQIKKLNSLLEDIKNDIDNE